MGRTSRTKGAVGERAAAEILRAVFPSCARRAAGEESQERRGIDLKGTPGWAVQVNVSKAPAPLRKFREVSMAVRDDEKPLVLFREQSRRAAGQPWLACLRADDLVSLLRSRLELVTVVAKAHKLLVAIDGLPDVPGLTDSREWTDEHHALFRELADVIAPRVCR